MQTSILINNFSKLVIESNLNQEKSLYFYKMTEIIYLKNKEKAK